jgi:hypothetical protein
MGFLDRMSGKGEVGPNLQIWAHDRGLEWVPEADRIEGIALPLWGDRHSNFCIGKLDGKEFGVVFHNSSVVSRSTADGTSQDWRRYTQLAVRVPEALAPLQCFLISNGPRPDDVAPMFPLGADVGSLQAESVGLGSRRKSGGIAGFLGYAPRWQVLVRMGSDTSLFTELVQGPLGEALELHDARFCLEYCFGTLTLTVDAEFLDGGPMLDAAVELLCLAARELRAAALERLQAQPFDTALTEPDWVNAAPAEQSEGTPRMPKTKKWGPLTVQIPGAGEAAPSMRERFDPFARGAPYEDALAYHVAFPANPAPGAALVVWRKERDGRTVRLALHQDGIGGGGPCVALVSVNGSAEDRPSPITTEAGVLGIGVRDGLMAAWMYRNESNFTPELLDLIEGQATQVAKQQGWVG